MMKGSIGCGVLAIVQSANSSGLIDAVIVTAGKQPAHYLVYGGK
jgi:hypothetical protein